MWVGESGVHRLKDINGVVLCLFLGVLEGFGCNGGYVLRSSYFQMELLAHRVPLEEALAHPEYTPKERERLEEILHAQQFAEEAGLKTGETYTSVARNWPRELFNISACEMDSFTPVTWNFPIVGTVPYLGFFRREDAYSMIRELTRTPNVEVYARPVGAYSTLGYFDDPILPSMLTRGRFGALRTVFHELAHGTLWLPGSVGFNESFASFVGETLAVDYFRSLGPKGESTLIRAIEGMEDHKVFEGIMRGVYGELDALYGSSLSRDEKLLQKKIIIESISQRVQQDALHHAESYEKLTRPSQWNNARLIQFRAYNDLKPLFEKVYEAHGRDLGKLLKTLSQLPSEAAFRTLAGGNPPPG